MVIADRSVWVEYIRRPTGPVARAVDTLLDSDRLATAGLVISEVLQGAAEGEDFRRLERMLVVLPFVENTPESWVLAGRISMDLRRRGVDVPLSDIVIAAAALTFDHEIYTLDQQFERIPGLRIYKPEGDDR